MEEKTKRPSAVPGWAKVLITVGVIVGTGALIFTQLPRDVFSTDLTRIGQGTPALVVARDDRYVAGAEVMDLLNSMRPEFSERVEFLAVNLGNPQGDGFVRQHGMEDGMVVLFSANGTRIGALGRPATQQELRQLLGAANIR